MTDPPAGVAVGTRSAPSDDTDLEARLAYRVRFDEASPSGTIRTSVLLRYAADLASVHSERRGFDRAWYREHGLAWLVRGVDLEVLRPIVHGDEIVGTTRAVAARKVLARRRTDFRTADGAALASLVVDWVLTSSDGAPTRIPPIFDTVFGMTARTFEPVRVRPVPPFGEGGADLRVRPQELDPMAHVNNAVYLDWAEEAIWATGRPPAADLDSVPRHWRLEYLGSAGPATQVRSIAWLDGDGWSVRISDGATGDALVGAHLTV